VLGDLGHAPLGAKSAIEIGSGAQSLVMFAVCAFRRVDTGSSSRLQ
jgi:hypothetical protein